MATATKTKATKTKMKVQPLADRVVVEPLEESEEMRGGLYIPDTAKEKPQQGTVVAVGPGRLSDEGERMPVELETGQRILYGKYSVAAEPGFDARAPAFRIRSETSGTSQQEIEEKHSKGVDSDG
jgi:chaperonin GroES